MFLVLQREQTDLGLVVFQIFMTRPFFHSFVGSFIHPFLARAPYLRDQSDDHGIWWEDVLQTGRALMTEQGRPNAPLSAIAAKFKIGSKDGGAAGCPTFLFWRKGARMNQVSF